MEFTNILEISYKHLPDCLKPCFLYFGSFPEDTSISVSKLIQIWISEEFVQEVNLVQKSLEEEAKSYLDELIDRSLVMISRKSSKGGVKACRVHDILRDFCTREVQQERHIGQLYNFGGLLCILSDRQKKICSLLYHYRPSGRIEGHPESADSAPAGRRGHSMMGKPPTGRKDKPPTGRSFHSIRGSSTQPRKPGRLDYGFFLQYKLLTVLDLGSVGVESRADFSDLIKVAELAHLRYLAIRPCTNEIPKVLGNLRRLETLILKGTIGYILIPESLWDVKSLRNVLMDHGFFNFQQCSKNFVENFQMDNLKSISTLSLKHGNDVENVILSRLPGIQKLACRFFSYSWDDATGCSVFPVLEFLNELESLKVFFSGKVRCPCRFSFPSNLTKLSLSNSRLPWEEISVIGKQLPNLEVLKLLNKAFEGRHWSVGDDEFQKLRFLKLDSLDFQTWTANAEHLPCLEQLVVQCCPLLEVIPSSFGEISTLQLIEMKWCSSSAMDSVNQILEIQRDLSNDQLNVTLVVIGRQLTNLEVIKLLNKAFEGQQSDTRDGEFQKLKLLKLNSLDIEAWIALDDRVPCLEQLVVLSCPQLEEIPSSRRAISTLQLIEMKWCISSAMDSVKQILKIQRDLSNYQFNISLLVQYNVVQATLVCALELLLV